MATTPCTEAAGLAAACAAGEERTTERIVPTWETAPPILVTADMSAETDEPSAVAATC